MPNIIGGKYKRKKITVPEKLVRPTSALKREAVFSVVESYAFRNSINMYKNKSIIDVYAGSGLIGLEAISRGMKKAYFIENNESVFKILQNNCKKLCKNNEYEIIFGNAINAFNRTFEVEPSIVFLDPPYFRQDINLVLLEILKNKILSKDTIIIIETNREEQIIIPTQLKFLNEKIYGKTKIIFLN